MPYTELPPYNEESSDRALEDPLLIRQRRRSAPSNPPNGRILDRDADFFQSRGRWNGVELLPRASGRRSRSSLSVGSHFQASHRRGRTLKRCLRRWFPLLWDDWFHALAYQRTLTLMLIIFVTYTAIVVMFGFIYLGVSIVGAEHKLQPDGSHVTTSFCDMDINDHMEALYFSLSTMTTIGYGVSDYYFGGCWTPLLLVLCQVCTAITFDAIAVGLLFTRLSRGRKRSKTIVVSNQAVVQVVQGMPYFMFRVGELRRFPLMDASVRVFCIRHERIPRVYPSPPTTAAAPPPPSLQQQALPKNNHTNNPGNIPVETTHFVTRAMKLLHPDESLMHSNHILMSLPQVIVHRMDDKSPLMPMSEWYDAHGRAHTFPQNKDNPLDVQSQIQDFWRDRRVEVVVLVGGIDELTGTAVQTRHSYCCSNNEEEDGEEERDVAWNRAFVNCVLPYHGGEEEDDEDSEGRPGSDQNCVCTVDFARFHHTVPTSRDCLASPYVPY